MHSMVTKYFAVVSALIPLAIAQSAEWGQCGGIGWAGPTTCVSGTTCVESNPYYSQCLPGVSTIARSFASHWSVLTVATIVCPRLHPLQPVHRIPRALQLARVYREPLPLLLELILSHSPSGSCTLVPRQTTLSSRILHTWPFWTTISSLAKSLRLTV